MHSKFYKGVHHFTIKRIFQKKIPVERICLLNFERVEMTFIEPDTRIALNMIYELLLTL